ncbi:phosphotriesterase-related protein [Actinotalea ferrariae]|uniref:phosphotriesterase family protein n=1 Tax=Actinotalea ferrariae TaxID=1386098 RepID=UPI001C8C3F70|nr:phosphotriesterase-related protein [Actinotalea ferrariae]MBX9244148.1 phosphotriesterase-related protein [Actinotalea ferrariae]
MATVRTVLGDIDTAEMGYTMPHEHILTNPQGHGSKNEEDHLLNSYDKAVQMLTEYREIGGGTIIEATPKTWGRNAAGMYKAAMETGVHVIACTGYICQEHGMEPNITERGVEDIAREMVEDLTVGMDGTDAKAGWIKVGTAYMHVTPGEDMVIRAAVHAANATGAPISTHTTGGTMGIEQLEIAASEGFDLTRMTIAHVDRNPDLWYHRKMLETGASIIYDGPGKAKYYPDSIRIDLLRQLVADGFGDQLMICNDMGRRSHHTVYGFGPGWQWIKERFIPRLLEEGFSEEQVHKFMYENPARSFAFAAPVA